MSRFLLIIITILFTLVSCEQPTQISGGSTEFSYGFNIPENIYEFCGRENRSDDSVGFNLYCFNDFRAMSRCTTSEPNRLDQYSECNYDAMINIIYTSDQTNSSAEQLLAELIMDNYPTADVTYTTVERNVHDAYVAEISSTEPNGSPTLLTMIRTGKDTVITMKGKPSTPDEITKFQKAFEIVASSIFGRLSPQDSPNKSEN